MNNIQSLKLKEIDGNVFWILLIRYELSVEKCINLSNEELEEYFCSKDIKSVINIPPLPTLTLKGYLKISWSYEVKYDKGIDLFFPQKNPYINYALLYAKDLEKYTKTFLKSPL